MSDQGRSSGRNSDIDTPLSVAAPQPSKGKGLTVKCGKNSATFEKMKSQGRKLGKCIQFKEKWVTPSEFESMSQVQARKCIKFQGKPIGDWLASANNIELELLSQESQHSPSPSSNTATMALSSTQNSSHRNGDTVVTDVQTSVPNEWGDTSVTLQQQCSPVVHNHVVPNERGNTSVTLQQQCSPVVNINVTRVESSHRSQTPLVNKEFTQLMVELEVKLLSSLQEIIKQTVESLQEHITMELFAFREEVEIIQERVTAPELAESVSSAPTCQTVEPSNLNSPCHTTESTKLEELESIVQSLSSKHEKIERDKEREKRKCNLLIGNIAEEELVSDTTTKSIVDLFQNKLKLELTPLQATRIGKTVDTKNRLILVKMNSMADKIEVLKAAKLLKDTIIYIREDLSFNERGEKHWLLK